MVWREIFQVQVFLVSHSKQGEYQEDRKENPEDVTKDDDSAITDNVVVKLVVISVTRDHTRPQLQGEYHMGSCF